MSKLYGVSYGRSLWELNRYWTQINRIRGGGCWENHTAAQTPREAGLSLQTLIPGRMLKILISVLCCAVLFTVGILIGHYAIPKSSPPPPSWVTEVAKDLDESFIDAFISEVNNIQIEKNLRWVKEHLVVVCLIFILIYLHRVLTKVPHMATTPGDEETVKYMLNRWQDPDSGLDQAWREEYMVYLSFPDPNNPNKVTVGESGCRYHMELYLCRYFEQVIFLTYHVKFNFKP